MTIINIEGGHVVATDQPLTTRGLLLPYNEVGRTNVGRLMVQAGDISIPTDPAVISHNVDHVRQDVVARAVLLEDTTQGVYATYRYADTVEGRAAYEDATSPTGTRKRLSAEFGPVVVKDGKLVPGHSKLWGSAQVAAGAYPSAMVLAADTPDGDGNAFDTVLPDGATDDGQHINVAVDVLPADITATTTAGDTATYTPDAAPAPVNPEGESNVTAAAPAGALAPAPATIPGAPQVLATAPAPAAVVVTPRPVDLQQVYAAMVTVRQNPLDSEAAHALAALTDITVSGNNALPGSGVIQPNWLGQLYQGIEYVREYITLCTLGTQITLGGKKGFRIRRGTSGSPIPGPDGIPNGGNWAGNKTEINSYNGFSQTAESFRRNFAVGDDIAREFYDLDGGAPVVEGFLKLLIEDYMYWSDEWARYDEMTAAGAPVAAKTYPTDYPAEVGMLIQGILAVKRRKADKRRDVPTFAIANELAYEALAYAAGGAENLPAFVSLAISTASEGTVDGNVQIVEGETGIESTSSVMVGAKRGIEFDELPGGPLQINALDIARGGIDKAVHGYLQTFPVRTEAFVHIGTADAFAQETAYDLGRIIKQSTNVYRVVTAGTTTNANPTAPAVGATVASGTATLLRLA